MYRLRMKAISLLFIGMLMPAFAFAATMSGPFSIPNLDVLLQNIESQLPYLMRMVTGAGFVLGFYCIYKAVYQLKAYGQGISMMSQQHSITGPSIMLIMGAALVYYPSSINTMLITIFGSNNILAYPVFGDIDPSYNLMGTVLTKIVSLVGIIAFIRGLLMFYHIGEGKAQQGASFSKAFTHLLGGILALNIVGTAKIIGSTLGITW
jgi:intracellular multiplication protein IcmC